MQSFEHDGVVSIWAFLNREDPADVEKDVLRDFCGVDDYDLDFQQGATADSLQPLSFFVRQLSHADSFADNVLAMARRAGIDQAYGVIAQFDFKYEPQKVDRQISSDPVFIGAFNWCK